MRDEGVEVPDITAGGGPPGGGEQLDQDDPDVQAAMEKCQGELPQGAPGGRGRRAVTPDVRTRPAAEGSPNGAEPPAPRGRRKRRIAVLGRRWRWPCSRPASASLS